MLVRDGVCGGGGQQRSHLGGSWYGGRWSGDNDNEVEAPAVGGAGRARRARPRRRSRCCCPRGPSYPRSPACDWNAWMRSLTTTITPKHPKHSPNPYGEKAQASETSRRLGKSVDTQPGPACLGAGGGVGNSMRAAQAGLEEETPHGHRSSGPWSLAADGDQSPTEPGRPYRPGWRIDRSGGRLSAHSQAKLTGGWIGRGRGKLDEKGHGRGQVVQDHGKGDEWITPTGGDGCNNMHVSTSGCTLSHRTPDSSGGKSNIDVKCDQFYFRLGGILSSGMARIGITGFAEAGGTVGTPKFKSILRPLAAASMLPQGRLAGEHVLSTSLSGTSVGWAGSHLFLCYRINSCIDCHRGSRIDTSCPNKKTLSSVCVFPLGSGAGEIY